MNASERNAGLTADPLFVGATRPPMRWGVTYAAILLNAVSTMVIFLLSKNLLTLLLVLPVHGVCALLCARDAQYFDLVQVWAHTRIAGCFGNVGYWRGLSYSPLCIDLADRNGRRNSEPSVVIAHQRRSVAC